MAKYAVITGSSAGIGLELAKIAHDEGYELLLVADTPFAVDTPRGAGVETRQIDLSTFEGVDQLIEATGGRDIDVLCANAGHGLGRAFVDQDPTTWKHVVDTNITGTAYLLQRVLPTMTAKNSGKILVTGSVAGYIPGSFQAVYNGTKAFVNSFVAALQDEIKDADGVSITNLMPGPTDTDFFTRADMLDTSVGSDDSKEDPAVTARNGWDAMEAGKASVASGWKNKVQSTLANVLPASVLAGQHRAMAEPGSADD